MNFKAFYDKIVDLIYGNRRNIMRVSFSALALLLLIIVLFFSSDNFNINSEVDTLIKYIDGRQYTMAETYFDDIEKEFSDSKMSRFNKKASNVIAIALKLLDYGYVPNDREFLESLSGVGRKTTNVVLSELYGIPNIAVDTHVERVSKRLKS